jgi:hypothetical protein
MVGTGPRPSGYGSQLSDEAGSVRPLAAYQSRTIVLSLPPHLDFFRHVSELCYLIWGCGSSVGGFDSSVWGCGSSVVKSTGWHQFRVLSRLPSQSTEGRQELWLRNTNKISGCDLTNFGFYPSIEFHYTDETIQGTNVTRAKSFRDQVEEHHFCTTIFINLT